MRRRAVKGPYGEECRAGSQRKPGRCPAGLSHPAKEAMWRCGMDPLGSVGTRDTQGVSGPLRGRLRVRTAAPAISQLHNLGCIH